MRQAEVAHLGGALSSKVKAEGSKARGVTEGVGEGCGRGRSAVDGAGVTLRVRAAHMLVEQHVG